MFGSALRFHRLMIQTKENGKLEEAISGYSIEIIKCSQTSPIWTNFRERRVNKRGMALFADTHTEPDLSWPHSWVVWFINEGINWV